MSTELPITREAYDPLDPRVIADPYPFYALLRREAPVHKVERHGFFVLTRYEDVCSALLDPETFSSTWGAGPIKVISPVRMILHLDPPEHGPLRAIIAKAFTPNAMRRVEPRIRELAEGLVGDLLARGEVDLVSDFAVPLPVGVIAELLGVPRSDLALFKKWSDDIVAEIGARTNASASRRAFDDYFNAVLRERRRKPGDDMVSRLCEPGASGEKLSDPEVLAFCRALLVAGNETTTALISNLGLALGRRPALWQRLRAEPSLCEGAVEESLRFDSPNQGLFRHTTRDVVLHGERIPAGSKVLASFGAANRDPAQFERPDVFDPTREPNRHVAFGVGVHHCLGAALGRLEAQVALRALARRAKEIRLRDEPISWVPIFFVRAPERLRAEIAAV
jgi:cytochrome P450